MNMCVGSTAILVYTMKAAAYEGECVYWACAEKSDWRKLSLYNIEVYEH